MVAARQAVQQHWALDQGRGRGRLAGSASTAPPARDQSEQPAAQRRVKSGAPEQLVPRVGGHRLDAQRQVEGDVGLRLGVAQLRQQQQQAVRDGGVDGHAVACGRAGGAAGGGGERRKRSVAGHGCR